jgi:hypothetical protein
MSESRGLSCPTSLGNRERIGFDLLFSSIGPNITRPDIYQDLLIAAVQPAHAGVHLGPHTRSAGPTIHIAPRGTYTTSPTCIF